MLTKSSRSTAKKPNGPTKGSQKSKHGEVVGAQKPGIKEVYGKHDSKKAQIDLNK